MAIGSDGEIGIRFDRWGNMTVEQQDAWFAYMRTTFGPDLMGGYGLICYPDRKINLSKADDDAQMEM